MLKSSRIVRLWVLYSIDNITKTVVNISHEDDEELEDKQQKEEAKQTDSDDDLINDHDRLTFLLENEQHQENQHFNLVVKNQSQLYYFENKAVHSIYNVLANFIANQMDSIDITSTKSINPAYA